MREKFNHLYVDSQERTLLLQSLVELKYQLTAMQYLWHNGATTKISGGDE